jgi:hypothetical protein
VPGWSRSLCVISPSGTGWDRPTGCGTGSSTGPYARPPRPAAGRGGPAAHPGGVRPVRGDLRREWPGAAGLGEGRGCAEVIAAARTIGARRCRRGCADRSGRRSGRGRRGRSRGGCHPVINAGRATNWAEQARPTSRPCGVCFPENSSPPASRPFPRVIGEAGPTVARYARVRALPVGVIAAGRGTDGPSTSRQGLGNAVGVAVTLPDWLGHRASRA